MRKLLDNALNENLGRGRILEDEDLELEDNLESILTMALA